MLILARWTIDADDGLSGVQIEVTLDSGDNITDDAEPTGESTRNGISQAGAAPSVGNRAPVQGKGDPLERPQYFHYLH